MVRFSLFSTFSWNYLKELSTCDALVENRTSRKSFPPHGSHFDFKQNSSYKYEKYNYKLEILLVSKQTTLHRLKA